MTVLWGCAFEDFVSSGVEKLSRAAREHIANSKDAESFMLINRLRDWKPEG